MLVHAHWDPEASVWVATSEDVPGLATEADTAEALDLKLRVMIPELLRENGLLDQGENTSILSSICWQSVTHPPKRAR